MQWASIGMNENDLFFLENDHFEAQSSFSEFGLLVGIAFIIKEKEFPFFCGKLCENTVFDPLLLVDSRALRLREMRALAMQFLYSVSRAYKCKILKFGFSYKIMSPSVGLTFPVSYTFCLNNIMSQFK
jgi:hypothetical protein